MNEALASPDYATFSRLLSASGCSACNLSQTRTHIVVDRGNASAKILFIGEAPGENEDRQGKAFVGRAGKLLDTMLAEAGIDPATDILIANVVKCRPPGNRRPKREEAETCLPYLKKQVALVNPQMMVLLGATALKYFVRRSSFAMQAEAGKRFRDPAYPGVEMMVLFHPAYLLYDPRKRGLMREHLSALKKSLENSGILRPASSP